MKEGMSWDGISGDMLSKFHAAGVARGMLNLMIFKEIRDEKTFWDTMLGFIAYNDYQIDAKKREFYKWKIEEMKKPEQSRFLINNAQVSSPLINAQNRAQVSSAGNTSIVKKPEQNRFLINTQNRAQVSNAPKPTENAAFLTWKNVPPQRGGQRAHALATTAKWVSTGRKVTVQKRGSPATHKTVFRNSVTKELRVRKATLSKDGTRRFAYVKF
jgi:hypothetical protein